MIVGLLTDEPVQPLPALLGAKFDGDTADSKIMSANGTVRPVSQTKHSGGAWRLASWQLLRHVLAASPSGRLSRRRGLFAQRRSS